MPKASQPSVEAQSSVAAPVSGAVAAVCAKLGDGEMALGRPWCWPRVCGVAAAQRLPQLWVSTSSARRPPWITTESRSGGRGCGLRGMSGPVR
jgi:hypothetical protein